jgi:hypothetical protein
MIGNPRKTTFNCVFINGLDEEYRIKGRGECDLLAITEREQFRMSERVW